MNHAFPQLHCFDIIPSTPFLCALQWPPITSVGGLEVSSADIAIFKALRSMQEGIGKAIKVFSQRKKSSNADVDMDDEDEDIEE